MLFQRKCLLLLSFLFVCAVTLLSGCDEEIISPSGYDFSRPQNMELGKGLVEISGIHFAGDGKLVSISDSRRNVIEIDIKNKKLADITNKVVPPDSDLEDIVLFEGTMYLLASRGTIFEVPKGAKDSASVVTYDLPLEGKNDFETMYYDPEEKGLILICKSCETERGTGMKSAFRFDLNTKTFDSTTVFRISTKDVRALMKNDDAEFDPSAAAIHPVSKRLYVLSSAGNLLVVTDTRGKVLEAYPINPDDFPQAEGIAFAPNGDMYISNEGKYGKANLLIFPFRQQQQKK